MAIPVADDVGFWRERAVSARAAASEMADQWCRDGVLAIADSYERMARMAQRRLARQTATTRTRFGFLPA